MNEQRTREWITDNEGVRYRMYICPSGFPTIGIGHRLSKSEESWYKDREISWKEVQEIFDTDFHIALNNARRVVPNFDELSDNRQMVFVDMAFQMGRLGLSKFKRMLRAVGRGDFVEAAADILDSKYARQTPVRARKNAEMILEG